MKSKPRGGVSSKVASSTLAYSGNSFKYSPLLPNDAALQKPDLDGTTSGPTESTAANTTSPAFCHREGSGSGPTPRKKGQMHRKRQKEVFDFDQLSRQSKTSSQECDEIYSPPVQDASASAKEDQEQHQPKKEIEEILQKVESNIREIELFSMQLDQKVENGPQKY